MHNSLTRNKNSTKDTWGPHWSAPEGAGGGRSIYKRNSARSYPSHLPVLAGEAPSAPLAQRRAASLLERNVPAPRPDYGELCREPRHPARARGRHWRRGSRAEAEAEKKWSRKGWPRESREGGGAGAGMRARPGGVGGAGCASVGRSVSRSVRAARAPASPASSARPRQRSGLAPPPSASLTPSRGSSLIPAARPAGPTGFRQPGRPSPGRFVRSLPLPPLAFCLWLPLAPVPFMKRGPITC